MPDDENVNQPESIPASVWAQHIPAELKDKGYWEPVKDADLGTVLKNYGNAQERIGSSVSIPKEDDADGWRKLGRKLGVPEKPEEYSYTLPKVDGAGDWNKDLFTDLNKVAHEHNIPQKSLEAVVKWYTSNVTKTLGERLNKVNEQAAVTETKLKREYADNYDANLAFAKRAGKLYFGDQLTETIIDNMDEAGVRGLMKLGTQLNESGIFGRNPVQEEGVVSRKQAVEEIAKVQGNREHPYWSNVDSPEKQAAQKRMEELHAIAYPDEG